MIYFQFYLAFVLNAIYLINQKEFIHQIQFSCKYNIIIEQQKNKFDLQRKLILPDPKLVLQRKCFKIWNYYHTRGSNVDNGHTSRMCAKPGPLHNQHTTRTNMMNGLPAGLHKTILPLASGRTTHVPRQQRPPTPAS
jgi:hypothetical protein